jgi:hypothetical protein
MRYDLMEQGEAGRQSVGERERGARERTGLREMKELHVLLASDTERFYCFSCEKCFLKNGFSNANCGACQPGPAYAGGVAGECGPVLNCLRENDSINGVCLWRGTVLVAFCYHTG